MHTHTPHIRPPFLGLSPSPQLLARLGTDTPLPQRRSSAARCRWTATCPRCVWTGPTPSCGTRGWRSSSWPTPDSASTVASTPPSASRGPRTEVSLLPPSRRAQGAGFPSFARCSIWKVTSRRSALTRPGFSDHLWENDVSNGYPETIHFEGLWSCSWDTRSTVRPWPSPDIKDPE